MAKIKWNENGCTTVQENDPEKHTLGIDCFTEDGMVVQVRTRHTHGEEVVAKVLYNGEPALPMKMADFEKLFKKDQLEIK